MNTKLVLGILALVIIVGAGGYWYWHTTPPILSSETASWNSYTYPSTISEILPDITFKYPPEFGNGPTHISSLTTNRPDSVTQDWGGLLSFFRSVGRPRFDIEFFKHVNTAKSFEDYVNKIAASTEGLDSPKYFQAGPYRVARLRFASPNHYDADTAWYSIELPNKEILGISIVPYDKTPIFDEKSGGLSTMDTVVSTLTIAQ